MRRVCLGAVLFLLTGGINSCQTATEAVVEETVPWGGSAITECQIRASQCPTNEPLASTVCHADTYNKKPLSQAHVLTGFGATECLAREDLARVACLEGKKPQLIGSPRCVAAAFPQGCPPQEDSCSGVVSGTVCRGTFSDDASDLAETKLVGAGANRCRAMAALWRQACRMGVSPVQTMRVECATAAWAAECVSPGTACGADSKPVVCRDPLRTTVSFGRNECLARAELRKQACALNLNPTPNDRIHCEEE